MWVWKYCQNSLTPKSKTYNKLRTSYMFPETFVQNTLDSQGKTSSKGQE